MKKMSRLPVVALIAAISFPVSAHSPFLLPNVFDAGEEGVITLDATFGEYFFVPDRVFSGSVFEVRGPDGTVTKPDAVMEFKTRAVLEHTMPADGTYRFSTGWRSGDAVKTYELNGETARLRSIDDPLPAGAKLTAYYQGKILSETYATRGVPSAAGTGALLPRGDGLELVASINPNELFAGEVLPLKTLVDGKAAAGVLVEIYLAARQAEGSEPTVSLQSDKDGMINFTPPQAGIYVLRARHNAAPASAAVPEVRYTYTLVLEATD